MEDNLDILFLSGLFPKGKEDEILSNSINGVQNAANVLQHGIVSGLDINCPGQVRILNSLHVGSFPKHYKKLFTDSYAFSQTSSLNGVNVGYCNLTGIKHICRYLAMKPHIKKWASEKTGKKKIVIAYAAISTFTGLLRYAKKINSDVSTCLIIADLPQHMNAMPGKKMIYKEFVKQETKRVLTDIPFIDSFVLFTEHMRDALYIKTPYVVVEGISAETFKSTERVLSEKGIKTILYSGSLTKKYGITDLVESFMRLPNKEYRLVICGEGETEGFIRQKSVEDDRIIFRGLLKREEALGLQKSASVLVNPRQNNEEYTKYSFPSKIMEYMSSGTPVVAYKLDGIPDEYYDYMFVIDESRGKDAIFSALKEVLSKPDEELSEMGRRASAFVLSEKNAAAQTSKIIHMIKNEL